MGGHEVEQLEFCSIKWLNTQRGGILENSGEMLGWELRELRELVTKNNKISKSSHMRISNNLEKNRAKKEECHRSRQVRDSARDSARDSGNS
jgi:hypothetical protein